MGFEAYVVYVRQFFIYLGGMLSEHVAGSLGVTALVAIVVWLPKLLRRSWGSLDALRKNAHPLLMAVAVVSAGGLFAVPSVVEQERKVLDARNQDSENVLDRCTRELIERERRGDGGASWNDGQFLRNAIQCATTVVDNARMNLLERFPDLAVAKFGLYRWSGFIEEVTNTGLGFIDEYSEIGKSIERGEPSNCSQNCRWPGNFNLQDHQLMVASLACFRIIDLDQQPIGGFCLASWRPHEFDHVLKRIPEEMSREIQLLAKLLVYWPPTYMGLSPYSQQQPLFGGMGEAADAKRSSTNPRGSTVDSPSKQGSTLAMPESSGSRAAAGGGETVALKRKSALNASRPPTEPEVDTYGSPDVP
jgi:hypothetical protein